MLTLASPETLAADLGRAAVGGVLIGAAAGLLMWGNGRVAGISGILAGALDRRLPTWREDLAFLVGLPLGLGLVLLAGGSLRIALPDSPALLLAAGLLVGFGARLGNGCTSGHGVCGLARLSPRSLVATLTFMAAAVATVALRGMWR